MPLTDTAIRQAKAGDKPRKLADELGLYLLLPVSGGKLWRYDYRYAGKRKTLALGAYPDVPLAAARAKRDDARKALAAGTDPGAAKQADKLRQRQRAADSFEAVAEEWRDQMLADRAESHRTKVWARLSNDVFPYIGRRPIAEITAPEVRAVLDRILGRNVIETAKKAQINMGQVFRFAIATGRATNDPTAALRGMLPTAKARNMAAPTEPAAVGGILRMFDALTGQPQVIAAVKLAPLVACRPGELRTMRWEDVDLDAAEWRYHVTKTDIDHIVPLSSQAVAILRDLHPLTGHLIGGWVFVGGRTPLKAMSNAAINAAMRRLGIDTQEELTGHGWRAVLRTIGHEQLGLDPLVIETQLAHKTPDGSGLSNAYARTKFLAERRQMMQQWADYLDKLKVGAQVIQLPGAAAA